MVSVAVNWKGIRKEKSTHKKYEQVSQLSLTRAKVSLSVVIITCIIYSTIIQYFYTVTLTTMH